MRFDGRLAQWDDQRGFGFIEPTQGGERVFVHIKSMERPHHSDAARPQVGDRLSFEIAVDERGRKQARHVKRSDGVAQLGSRPPTTASRRPQERHRAARASRIGMPSMVLLLALVGLMAWQLYPRWAAYGPGRAATSVSPQPLAAPGETAALPVAGTFRCDGRQHCSQMTSCAEATYFLRNCPGTRMDGNGDGVPCEQQWCTTPWAK